MMFFYATECDDSLVDARRDAFLDAMPEPTCFLCGRAEDAFGNPAVYEDSDEGRAVYVCADLGECRSYIDADGRDYDEEAYG